MYGTTPPQYIEIPVASGAGSLTFEFRGKALAFGIKPPEGILVRQAQTIPAIAGKITIRAIFTQQ